MTSLSADIHKYGYAFKGVVDDPLPRSASSCSASTSGTTSWPGGLYASATTAGTRPAPPIAGAWAAINHLGRRGLPAAKATAGPRRRRARSAPASRRSTGCPSPTHPTSRVFEFDRHRRLDIAGVADAMDRPRLEPRPPAGRPAPDALAGTTRRSPSRSWRTSRLRSTSRPPGATESSEMRPTAASPEGQAPVRLDRAFVARTRGAGTMPNGPVR